MKLGKVLLVAAAGIGLLAFAAPANAQMRGRGGASVAAFHGHSGGGWHGNGWHGHPGWGWGHPGWGWRGNIAFGFYGYPYGGWGYPYGYPYGYYAYPPPPPYYAGNQQVYSGRVVHRQQRDSKDVQSDQ